MADAEPRLYRCTGNGSGFEPLPPSELLCVSAEYAAQEYAKNATARGYGSGELLVAATPVSVRDRTLGTPEVFRFDCALEARARLIPDLKAG